MSPSLGQRLLKWVAAALLLWIVVSVLPVMLLRWWHPPTSAIMLEARLEALTRHDDLYRTHFQWVDYAQISPQAALAVIASEDQQFPFHHGFDLQSIREAQRNNERGGRLRGASTISQQVAKNLFLWPGRSYLRKALEAWFTALLELLWPKQRILEMYLNIAEFAPGVYGVGAAARELYHKSAAQLTAADAATLAAVLPNPRRLHAQHPSHYVLERGDWIMGQMRDLGGVTYLNEVRARR